MSKYAITYQLDLVHSNYHAMFYKYVLYKIRLITKEDLISTDNILSKSSLEDENVS